MPNLERPNLGGMDLSPNPAPSSAALVENMRFDPRVGAWTNDRGWGQFWSEGDASSPITLGFAAQQTPFVAVCTYAGRDVAILYEQELVVGGTSYGSQLRLITPSESARSALLEQERAVPGPTDPGTFAVPFGRVVLIINGNDEPRVLRSGRRLHPFGFHLRPSAPRPVTPAASINVWGGGTPVWISDDTSTTTGTASPVIGVGVESALGLVQAEGGETISYQYAVSFVSWSGSEGPLSPVSPKVTVKPHGDHRTILPVEGLPVGPDGTVARRIYRTKNMEVHGPQLFYVDQVPNNTETLYMDVVPDDALGAEAPSSTASDLFPVGSKFAAWFRGRLVVAGGVQHPGRVSYSHATQPETFPTANYLEIAGPVTGLHPYADLLLVFRAEAIDALVAGEIDAPPFRLAPITSGVGTSAPKTVVTVPGIGVMFLGRDGFYLLTGSAEHGIRVARVSDMLGNWIARVNSRAVARACATYNVRDAEYWASVPCDGSAYPSIGFVYSVAADAWSVRTGIPAASFAQLPSGHTVFGSHAPASGQVDTHNKGLFVWSAVAQWGYEDDSGNPVKVGKPVSRWRSVWLDMDRPTETKRIQRVTVEVVTTGTDITLDYWANGYDAASSAPAVARTAQTQPTTSRDEPVVGTLTLSSSTTWQGWRRAWLRWDIDVKSVHTFAFEVRSSERFAVVGYTINVRLGSRDIVWSPGVV